MPLCPLSGRRHAPDTAAAGGVSDAGPRPTAPPPAAAPPPAPAPESAVETGAATIASFRDAVAAGDLGRAGRVAGQLSAADLSDALMGLTAVQTTALYHHLGDERLADLVEHLDPEDASDVLRRLTDAHAADVLDELAPDDAADVIGAIKEEAPERAQPILVEMDRAGDVQELLRYLPDTAGGIMTTDFLAVHPEVTADETVRSLRARAHDGQFRSYVYATDEGDRLVGVIPLYRLVLVDPATRVGDIMAPDPVRVG